MSDDNPYQSSDLSLDGDSQTAASGTLSFGRVFLYSLVTSLAVSFAVAFTWLAIVVYPQAANQETPEPARFEFLFATARPSILTCLFFSFCYCSIVQRHRIPKIWPAILFGVISGLVFNAMTAITVLETFFDW